MYGHDTCETPTTRYDGSSCDTEFYTWSFSPGERIELAKERGMHYLAITDHNNLISITTPEWVAEKQRELDGDPGALVLIPAYENSLRGHAQMLNVSSCWDQNGANGLIDDCPRGYSGNPLLVKDAADTLRAAGGAFQANHPAEGLTQQNATFPGACPADPCPWDWKYGLTVIPDSVEVWNIPMQWQPPAPSASSNDDAVRLWEGFLNLGYRVAPTGGSDNHYRGTSPVQGIGQPTTWVYATERSVRGVIEGIRAGRTFISHQPPIYAGTLAYLEADADGDATFESIVGSSVPASSSFRLRVENAAAASSVRIITDLGKQDPVPLLNPLQPVSVTVPEGAKWVRAEVFTEDAQSLRTAGCNPLIGGSTTYCRNRLVMLALTSAIFIGN